MADAPTCMLCGNKHWSTQPCTYTTANPPPAGVDVQLHVKTVATGSATIEPPPRKDTPQAKAERIKQVRSIDILSEAELAVLDAPALRQAYLALAKHHVEETKALLHRREYMRDYMREIRKAKKK